MGTFSERGRVSFRTCVFFLYSICLVVCLDLVLPHAVFAQTNPGKNQRAAAAQNKSGKHVPGVVLLKLNAGKKVHELKDLTASYGLELEKTALIPELGIYRAHILPRLLKKGDEEKTYADALKKDPRLDIATEDRILAPALIPNDPQYATQWHLPKINAPAAWDSTTGSNTITIAILDTGVNGTHPDLAAKMVTGWNVYNNSSNTSDVYGHGTMVAGVAAAYTNNSVGMAGVAWYPSVPAYPKIMPIRISNPYDGGATSSDIAAGLVWAANNGARIANISYSALANDDIIDAAAYYFQLHNGLVVGAAGLSWGEIDQDDPYILSVNATDQNDAVASLGSIGNFVDVSAPGVGITSTDWTGGYSTADGISMAAPIVSGVAALVMSKNLALTPAQVAQIIKLTAVDLGAPGYDMGYGTGRVNALAAVNMALTPPPSGDTTPPIIQITSPTSGANVSGNVPVQYTASDNVGLSSVNLTVDGVLTTVNTSPTSGNSIIWESAKVLNGQHVLRLDAVDKSFNTNTAPAQITVNVNNPIDMENPFVSFNCPHNNDIVSGTRDVLFSSGDNTATSRLELSVDGGPAFASSTRFPYTISWNTSVLLNGAHSLTAKIFDIGGRFSSTTLPVTVRNIGADITPPLAPRLLAPLFGEVTTNSTPTFTWSSVTDPSGVSYRLRVGTDYQISTPVVNVTVPNTTYTLASPLAVGNYYWRVDSIDGAGNIETCGFVYPFTIPGAILPTILSSNPPDGYVDPLEDRSATDETLLGTKDISITFSAPVRKAGGGPLTIANFARGYFRGGVEVNSFTADLYGRGLAPTVTLVSGSGAGPYLIHFHPRIPLGAWTQITAINVVDSASGNPISPTANSIVLGALPMDTSQDGHVLGDDITRWLAINNNVFSVAPLTKLNFCDQKRNGVIAGEDITRAQQLINGIATYQTWSGFDMGARP